MDTCSVRGDPVSQTNVLSFARINVVYLPELGGQLPPPDPPSRTPMLLSNEQASTAGEDFGAQSVDDIALNQLLRKSKHE